MSLFSLIFGGDPVPDPAVKVQLARIERKLDAIITAIGVQVPSDGLDDIRDLVARNRKIEAIKLYRERTGVGLAEAKAVVDSLS